VTRLEEYVNFAHSLIDMDEVKKGKFPLPKEIVFQLNSIQHAALQTQVHDARGLKKDDFEHQEVFTMSVLGIDFKFIENGK
jgi:hypothetical protein